VREKVVVCGDGTNSSFQWDIANVALMNCVAVQAPGAQHVYYDVGIGVGNRDL
jgi:uncharacterized protein (DUF2235 family)